MMKIKINVIHFGHPSDDVTISYQEKVDDKWLKRSYVMNRMEYHRHSREEIIDYLREL
jgi:hypothetical protein